MRGWVVGEARKTPAPPPPATCSGPQSRKNHIMVHSHRTRLIPHLHVCSLFVDYGLKLTAHLPQLPKLCQSSQPFWAFNTFEQVQYLCQHPTITGLHAISPPTTSATTAVHHATH
jgi:hypothetical protein